MYKTRQLHKTHLTTNSHRSEWRCHIQSSVFSLKKKMILLFTFGCAGCLLLQEGFLQVRRGGATLCLGAQASHCRGFTCCGAWALEHRHSSFRCMGLTVRRPVRSSWTRDGTCVACTGRQIPIHCTTREALFFIL